MKVSPKRRFRSMKIILLFGGRGAEHEVSVLSAGYVYNRLYALGHEVFPIAIAKSGALFLCKGILPGAWQKDASPVRACLDGDTLSFLSNDTRVTPDLVFSVVHGKDGEDGAWQGLFTLARVPFVGADVCASALAMNKRLSKVLAAAAGVPSVPYLAVKKYESDLPARVAHRLRYPLFVKPTSGGSSIGVSRVESESALQNAVNLALSEDEEAMIEEAVDGSEIEVGVLERDGMLLISPPGELCSKSAFYDYNAKYCEKNTDFFLPARLSLWETAYVKQLAASVFRQLGCRGMARVDFLRGKDGKLFFNEINTLPGFTEDSLFPRLFSLIGVDAVTFLTEAHA
ncbi:MAG: D-alanine--D-alanine ligase [Ruminococcaceae bacterium]|nr:D-alanine--D-alanine ligase [Oscillospiraceae bacterium]